jgi:hypothetical protein
MMLYEWMQEFSDEFIFKRATFYLAVWYVDMFLTRVNDVPQSKFQLLGAAALFLAAKFEEVFPPRLKDIVYATDNGYKKEEVTEMEQNLLRVFEFRLSPQTYNHWLDFWLTHWDSYLSDKQESSVYVRMMDKELIPIFRSEQTYCYHRYRAIA